RDHQVLLGAISQGVNTLAGDTFAYAQGYDEASGRYLGLAAHQIVTPILDGSSLVVKSAVAQRQRGVDEEARRDTAERARRAAEEPNRPGPEAASTGPSDYVERGPELSNSEVKEAVGAPKLRRYHGTVETGPNRLGLTAATIASEIVQHLALLPGAQVNVTIEIQALVPEGVPENVVRTVTENSRTLHFTAGSFEES
ncbi:MAG: AAA+ family ATPase, partial [Chloroflexota bacterium]